MLASLPSSCSPVLLHRLLQGTLLRCFSTSAASNAANAANSSAELIAKWQGILQVQEQSGQDASSSSSMNGLHMGQLRQLCQDAIEVYSTEGATAVVPDRVTDIFMSAYKQLQAPQHKLGFFKLLVTEFGVQRRAIDEAVQLWLQRAEAAPAVQIDPQHTQAASPLSKTSTTDPTSSSAIVPGPVMYRLAERLSAASQPLYMTLLLPVSQHKSGIEFLVNLRGDLLTLLKEQPAADLGQQGAALRALDQDLRAALSRWFSLGLLQLQRITWENSPGQLLQRVQQTEAVHKMQHLEELQRRLQQSDRRVFAFMHPSLPGEPLVVLHTAITDHIPDSMQVVLTQQQQQQEEEEAEQVVHHSAVDTADTRSASTKSVNAAGQQQHGSVSSNSSRTPATVACFYSISSSQKGLAGVDLGNFLIKKAAQLLLSELPQLQTLVTLSPIPGFRSWLITKARQAAAGSDAPALLQESEAAAVLDLCSYLSSSRSAGPSDTGLAAAGGGSSSTSTSSSGGSGEVAAQPAAAAQALLHLIQENGWNSLPDEQQEALRPVLLRLCAVYLLLERRRNYALDPVAHFHLRNGAQLWRINWRADLSASGLSNSCGLMVNYLYNMSSVTANNQRYLMEHHINAADAVQQLLLRHQHTTTAS